MIYGNTYGRITSDVRKDGRKEVNSGIYISEQFLQPYRTSAPFTSTGQRNGKERFALALQFYVIKNQNCANSHRFWAAVQKGRCLVNHRKNKIERFWLCFDGNNSISPGLGVDIAFLLIVDLADMGFSDGIWVGVGVGLWVGVRGRGIAVRVWVRERIGVEVGVGDEWTNGRTDGHTLGGVGRLINLGQIFSVLEKRSFVQ